MKRTLTSLMLVGALGLGSTVSLIALASPNAFAGAGVGNPCGQGEYLGDTVVNELPFHVCGTADFVYLIPAF